MDLMRNIRLFPPGMRVVFFSYLLLPLLALLGTSSPLHNFLRIDFVHFLIMLGAYFLTPWFICYLLLRHSALVLPVVLTQLLCLILDAVRTSSSPDGNFDIAHLGLAVVVAMTGLMFVSRDILFPLLSARRRGFRRAPRLDANHSCAIVDGEQRIRVTMENLSLTGLAVFGDQTTIETYLARRKTGKSQPIAVQLRLSDPSTIVSAYLASQRSEGAVVRLGLGVSDSDKMRQFITSLHPRGSNFRQRVHLMWISSYFQRLAITAWSLSLAGAIFVPSFHESHASDQQEDSRKQKNELAAISPQNLDGRHTSGDLVVQVEGFSSDSGVLRLAVDNSPESYLVSEFLGANAQIADRQSTFVFKNVPFGEYAIRLFHDENGNGKLDTNILGIPTEAYGFSNDARSPIGAPSFAKSKFQFGPARQTVTIRVATHL